MAYCLVASMAAVSAAAKAVETAETKVSASVEKKEVWMVA